MNGINFNFLVTYGKKHLINFRYLGFAHLSLKYFCIFAENFHFNCVIMMDFEGDSCIRINCWEFGSNWIV